MTFLITSYTMICVIGMVAMSAATDPADNKEPQVESDGPKTFTFLKHGLIMEPDDMVFSSYGFYYIPIGITIPAMTGAKLHLCKTQPFARDSLIQTWENSKKLIMDFNIYNTPGYDQKLKIYKKKNVKQYLNSKSKKSSRQKRFIGLVAGVLGGAAVGGLGIWNRVGINTLQEKVDFLNENIKIIDNNLNVISSNVKSVKNNQEQIFHLIDHTVSHLSSLEEQFNCLRPEINAMNEMIAWVGITFNKFIRAIDFALTGKVVPDLINVKNAQFLITNHLSLNDSLYSVDPTLIYKIGNFIVTSISQRNMRLAGILILPKISTMESGFSYNVYTASWISNDLLESKLSLPSSVIITTNRDTWTPDISECLRHPGLLICPLSNKGTKVNSCIESLLQKDRNITTSCRVVHKKYNEHNIQAFQLKSGVLLSGFKNGHVRFGNTKFDRFLTTPVVESNSARFFTKQDGDVILVNSESFQLADLSHPYEFNEEPLVSDLDYTPIDIIEATPNWQHVEDIKLDALKQWEGNNHTWIIYMVLSLIAIIGCVFFLLKWRTKRHHASKKEHMIQTKRHRVTVCSSTKQAIKIIFQDD